MSAEERGLVDFQRHKPIAAKGTQHKTFGAFIQIDSGFSRFLSFLVFLREERRFFSPCQCNAQRAKNRPTTAMKKCLLTFLMLNVRTYVRKQCSVRYIFSGHFDPNLDKINFVR